VPLGMEIGLSPGDFVLDGNPASLPKRLHGSRCHLVRWDLAPPPLKGHSPQFLVNVRYGQTAGWTEMPLGMEVGLGPDDFVFDGDPAPSKEKKAHSPHPIFGPCLLWPNGWMDQDANWYGGKRRRRRRCVRWGRSSPYGAQLPRFRFMSIVAKRLDG